MQPNNVRHSFYFYVLKGNKKVLNNMQLQQMLRSPPPSSRQATTIFTVLLCNFLKSLLVNAGKEPLQCCVKCPPVFLISYFRFFLSEIPTEKVKWHKVWEFWQPKSTSDNKEEVMLKKLVLLLLNGQSPHLAESCKEMNCVKKFG